MSRTRSVVTNLKSGVHSLSMPRPVLRSRISVLGAGNIGSKTVDAIAKMQTPCDVVFWNRNLGKAEGKTHDIEDALDHEGLLGKNRKKTSRHNNLTILPTDDISDISGSEVIVVTVGVSASVLNVRTREAALPAVSEIVKNIAPKIKKYAPDAFVILVTNPVDIVTKLMVEETGFDPGKVVGLGTQLDAKRFQRVFRRELEKRGYDNIKKIEAMVIGGHSKDHMIVVKDSVKIVTSSSTKGLDDFEEDSPLVWEAYSEAEKQMKEMGFKIIELSNEGASFAPAVLSAFLASSIVKSSSKKIDPIKFTGSHVLQGSNGAFGIKKSVVSLPLVMEDGLVSPDLKAVEMSEEETSSLKKAADFHGELLDTIKDIPESTNRRAVKAIDEIYELIEGIKKSFRSDDTPNSSLKANSHSSVTGEGVAEKDRVS